LGLFSLGATKVFRGETGLPSSMLSVIIPTHNSEEPLVRTLAALVPGATTGIVREVLVADGGSHDETEKVADVAGCEFLSMDSPPGRRLKAAAAKARSPWFLFLLPGTVLDAPWTGEVGRFIQQPAHLNEAAVFRRGDRWQPALRELRLLLSSALSGIPRAEQGLLLSRQLYDALGGHSEKASNPDYDLLRRIGRERSVRLKTNAFYQGPC
jgi:glycosyltransferase involved in cell wall biosynthesis